MKKLWFFAVFFLLLPFYSQANINNRRIGVIYVTQQAGLTSSFVAYAYKKGDDKKLIKIDLSDNIAPCKVKATPASFKDKYIYQPVSFQTGPFGDICPYVLKDNVCYKPILIKATTQALSAAKTAFTNRMNLIKTVLAYAQSKGYKAINVSFVFSCLINGQRRDIVDSVESFQLFQGGEFKPAVFSTGFYISNPDPVFIKIGYVMPNVQQAALEVNPDLQQIAWKDGILGRLVIQSVTLSGLKKTLINTQIDLNASTAREALNDILQQYKDIIQEQQPIFIKADILNGVYFNLNKQGKPALSINLAGKYLIMNAGGSGYNGAIAPPGRCSDKGCVVPYIKISEGKVKFFVFFPYGVGNYPNPYGVDTSGWINIFNPTPVMAKDLNGDNIGLFGGGWFYSMKFPAPQIEGKTYPGVADTTIQLYGYKLRLCEKYFGCSEWVNLAPSISTIKKAYAIYNINYQLGGTLYSYMVSYPGYSIQKTAVSQVTLNSTSLGIENGYRKIVNATTQAIASLNQLIKGETPAQIENNPYLKYYTFDPFNPVGSLIDARQWSEFGNWIRPFVIETQ